MQRKKTRPYGGARKNHRHSPLIRKVGESKNLRSSSHKIQFENGRVQLAIESSHTSLLLVKGCIDNDNK